MRPKCTLELSDGSRLHGELCGAPLISSGEMVFTTGMVGYSEALTDPSYFGQILTFTYPLIGNYGIPPMPSDEEIIPKGYESRKVHCSATILAVDSPDVFHWNSYQTIDGWLKEQQVPGIVGLDTRHLVHLIRNAKGLYGKIVPESPTGSRQLGSITLNSEQFFDPQQHRILPDVSCKKQKLIGKGTTRIGLVDCGVKWNIIRQLLDMDCEVIVCPWDTDFSKIDCHGWLISNGPGDPTQTDDLPNRIEGLLKQNRPVLGICLGHQILALAAGFKAKRMSYGHRSHNQPVYQVGTRLGYITSQNHGYVIDESTIPDDWEIWFRNINDESIEGIKHKSKPFASVQFHPEAAGGPRDTGWILAQFVTEVMTNAPT